MLEALYRNLCHNFSFTGDFILLFYFSQYISFHPTYSRSYHFAVMIKDIITEHSDNITHISIYSHSRSPGYPPCPDRLLCVNPQFLCDINFSMQRFPNEEICSGPYTRLGRNTARFGRSRNFASESVSLAASQNAGLLLGVDALLT